MGNEWYYTRDGKMVGPVSAEVLKRLAAAGKLQATDQVRKEGMAKAVPASQVKGLFPDLQDRIRAKADAVGKAAGTVQNVAGNVGKVADAVNEVGETAGKIQKAAGTVAGVAAGGSALAGSVGDFLRPLGNINLLVAVLAALAAGVLLILGLRKLGMRVRVKMKLGAVAFLCVALVFGLWTAAGAVAGKGDKGVLATNIPAVERAQAAVLPVKEQPPLASQPQDESVGEIRRFNVPSAVWSWAAFSPDGRRVLYCGLSPSTQARPQNENWFIELEWDAGKEIRRVALPDSKFHDVSFSPDRKLLLLSPMPGETPSPLLWDVEAGKEVRRLGQPNMSFTRAAFCPDGLHAVLGGGDALVLVEAATGRQVRRFEGADVKDSHRLAVSPDGKLLYTSGAGLVSRVWDVDSGKFLREIAKGKQGFGRPAFTPDSRFVLDGGTGDVSLWDVQTGKAAGSFEGLDQYVCAAFSTDDTLLVTGHIEQGAVGDLRVWDVAGRKEVVRLKGHAMRGGEGVDISPDGRYATSSSQDGTVRVWRLPKAGTVGGAGPVMDEFSTLTAKLGDLMNWTGAGHNDWQPAPGGFIGRGTTNTRFNERLPEDYALTFDMKVMSGKCPQAFVGGQGWEIMVHPKDGDDTKLEVQPRVNSPAMVNLSSVPIPYKADEVTKIKFILAGDDIECWINGKPAAKATRKNRGRTQLEVSCWDKQGLVEFTNFRITAP